MEIKFNEEIYDYENKYINIAKHIIDPKLPPKNKEELINISLEVHNSFNCNCISRIDFRYDEDNQKVFLLEVNTQPGLTKNSLLPEMAKKMGIDFLKLCKILIKYSKCEINFNIIYIFLGYIFLDHEKIFDKTNNFLNKKTIQIKLKNTNYVQKDYILKSLYIKNGDNFWVFSREKLKNDLDKIPEIESYSFKLEKNGILSILINEKKALYGMDFSNKKKIIDQNGNVLKFLKFPTKKFD